MQPPPPVLPWLAQPLPTVVWWAVTAAACAVVAAAARVRRSPDPSPISPRWSAVTIVGICGLFGALAFGGGLVHPAVAALAAPLTLAGVAAAWAGWHADPGRNAFVAQAIALPLAAGLTLALALVPAVYAGASSWGMGMGTGDALALLLPAAGTPAAAVLLLPHDHPRSRAASLAALLLSAAFTAALTLLTAGPTMAATTPLPFESPLADRYAYLNSTLAVASIVIAACACASGLSAWLTRRAAAITAMGALLIAPFLCAQWCAAAIGPPAFGQPAARSLVSFAPGVVLGLAAWSDLRMSATARLAVAIAAAVLAVGIAVYGAGAGGAPYTWLWNAALALLALLTAGALAHKGEPQRTTPPMHGAAAPRTDAPFIAIAVATLATLALTLCLRASLTQQAAFAGAHFRYNRLPGTDDFRRESVGHPHALRLGEARFAWVIPQATWWTADNAWRDALILTGGRPPAADASPAAPYYTSFISTPGGQPGDADFRDARSVAVTQPSFTTVKPALAVGVPARWATPAELAAWARFTPRNPWLWLGAAGGVLIGFAPLRRPTPPVRWLAIIGAAAAAAAVIGAPGAAAGLLAGSALPLVAAASRRTNGWS
ncbi:MAG: hypothetical protein K2Q09_07340 [Phycisphaerales bacterium]|nr:hypothetical protein [Phycisphaerales bacterium]